jgi:RNA recognition motif-containing protein
MPVISQSGPEQGPTRRPVSRGEEIPFGFAKIKVAKLGTPAPKSGKDQIMVNIYVGNLAYTVTDDELRQAFESFGAVDRASVVTDRMSGRSKGFGFVEMPKEAEARAAIAGLNETELKGRNILVNEARPQSDRPARRPSRRNEW